MKILIVGAGPSGMYSAIEIKNRFPGAIVDMVEFRPTPSRRQIVTINASVFDSIQDKQFAMQLQLLWVNGPGCCMQVPAGSLSADCWSTSDAEKFTSPIFRAIPLYILEITMRQYIKDRRILRTFLYTRMSVERLKTVVDVEEYNLIIGADGKNSIVKDFMGSQTYDCPKDQKSYGLVTFIPVNTPGLTRKQPPTNPYGPQDEYTNSLSSPQNRYRLVRVRDVMSPSMQDPLTGQQVPETSNSYALSFHVSPNELESWKENPQSFYRKWNYGASFYNLFDDVVDDQTIEKHIEFNPVEIDWYKAFPVANDVNVGKKQVMCVLIGDAASTTHFFLGHGLNKGFLNVNILVTLLEANGSISETAKLLQEKLTEDEIYLTTIDWTKIDSKLAKSCVYLEDKLYLTTKPTCLQKCGNQNRDRQSRFKHLHDDLDVLVYDFNDAINAEYLDNFEIRCYGMCAFETRDELKVVGFGLSSWIKRWAGDGAVFLRELLYVAEKLKRQQLTSDQLLKCRMGSKRKRSLANIAMGSKKRSPANN